MAVELFCTCFGAEGISGVKEFFYIYSETNSSLRTQRDVAHQQKQCLAKLILGAKVFLKTMLLPTFEPHHE